MNKREAIELLTQYLPPDRLYQVVKALTPDVLANGPTGDTDGEPFLEDCPWCKQIHTAGTVEMCPLNPNRQKTQSQPEQQGTQ